MIRKNVPREEHFFNRMEMEVRKTRCQVCEEQIVSSEWLSAEDCDPDERIIPCGKVYFCDTDCMKAYVRYYRTNGRRVYREYDIPFENQKERVWDW